MIAILDYGGYDASRGVFVLAGEKGGLVIISNVFVYGIEERG